MENMKIIMLLNNQAQKILEKVPLINSNATKILEMLPWEVKG